MTNLPTKSGLSDRDAIGNTETTLAEQADAIRALGKRVVDDVIEIGRRLTVAKKITGHGNWLPWLKREFEWSGDTALNFMQVHAMVSKNGKFPDLNLPVSALYLLAAPSTPQEARTEVIERAEKGETLTVADVKDVVARTTRGFAAIMSTQRTIKDAVLKQQKSTPLKEEAKAKADQYLANQGQYLANQGEDTVQDKDTVLAEDDLGEIADLHRCAEFCRSQTARTTVLNLSFSDRQVFRQDIKDVAEWIEAARAVLNSSFV